MAFFCCLFSNRHLLVERSNFQGGNVGNVVNFRIGDVNLVLDLFLDDGLFGKFGDLVGGNLFNACRKVGNNESNVVW